MLKEVERKRDFSIQDMIEYLVEGYHIGDGKSVIGMLCFKSTIEEVYNFHRHVEEMVIYKDHPYNKRFASLIKAAQFIEKHDNVLLESDQTDPMTVEEFEVTIMKLNVYPKYVNVYYE